MFIGAYLCTGAVFLAAGVALLSRLGSRRRSASQGSLNWRRYLLWSLGAMLGALTLFIAASLVMGIMHTGGAGSWSYPQDYLAGGPLAWLVMVVPIIGILAPLFLLTVDRASAGA